MLTRRELARLAGLGGLATMLPWQARAADTDTLYTGLAYADITSIDPHMAVASSDIPIVPHIYEAPVTFPNADLGSDTLLPSLATHWDSTPDKRRWKFWLRPGVRWHGDYGELTSDDMKFSIERVAGGPLATPFRSTMSNVEAAETDGPVAVVVRLRDPDPSFPELLVPFQAGFVVSRKAAAALGNLNAAAIGTGPFRLEAYRARQQLSLVRNDAYWGPRPSISRVVFQFMPDATSRELALRSDEMQTIDIEARQDVLARIRRQGLLAETTVSGSPMVLFVNLKKKPFDDVRVRRALAYATDRGSLAAFIGSELAIPEYSSTPLGYAGHIDDVEKYETDPAKALTLLADAGFPNGFAADVIISSSTLYLPTMEVLQEQWKKAKISLNLKVVDHPTYHRLIRQDASPLVLYWAARYPQTAENYFEQFYAGPASIGKPTAITNFSHYGDVVPGIDDLLDKARHTTDLVEQKRLWAAAQKKVAEDVPSIPLYNWKAAFARSDRFELGYPIGNLPYYTYGSPSRLKA